MRYIAAFGGDKAVCISTNPYGGVLPDLLPKLNRGRDFDRYRVMLYEAAAMGVNLSVPYGAWMGSVIEDAVWAPHEETVEIQDFLADHEDLYARRTANSTLIVYSIDSNYIENVWQVQGTPREERDVYPNVGEAGPRAVPFNRVAHAAALANRPFDVAVFHDGVHRDDDATVDALSRYERVVLPGCSSLTQKQIDALLSYLDDGGRVTVYGELGGPSGAADVERLRGHEGTIVVDSYEPDVVTPEPSQVLLRGMTRSAVNIQLPVEGRAALHVINYDYDTERECTPVATDVAVEVRLPFRPTTARVHAPGVPTADLELTADSGEGATVARVTVPEIGVYAIIEFA